jgi:2,6-dihydroxypseudooxynicotine hydrolase
MNQPDPRALAEHLTHRFVSNGVPLADHETTSARLSDWQSWCSTWEATGDARVKEAEAAESVGAALTAAQLRLVAAVEYHFAKFLFVHDMAALRAVHAKAVAAYRAAAPLLAFPARFVSVPHRGHDLPGVLRTPGGSGPWPTVIVVPGLDATKEEMHRFCQVFLERGMATYCFDGPGQGESEYDQHLPADWEHVGTSAVAALRTMEEVADDRIALVGVSLGGYFAARAGARTPGLVAAASVGGCYSMGQSWDNLSVLSRRAFEVRSGAGDTERAVELAERFTLDGCTPEHGIPFLVVHGGRDRLFDVGQAERTAALFGDDGQLVVEREGNHVLHNLAYRVRPQVADWVAAQLGVARTADQSGAAKPQSLSS